MTDGRYLSLTPWIIYRIVSDQSRRPRRRLTLTVRFSSPQIILKRSHTVSYNVHILDCALQRIEPFHSTSLLSHVTHHDISSPGDDQLYPKAKVEVSGILGIHVMNAAWKPMWTRELIWGPSFNLFLLFPDFSFINLFNEYQMISILFRQKKPSLPTSKQRRHLYSAVASLELTKHPISLKKKKKNRKEKDMMI